MTATDAQVRKLMEEHTKHGRVGVAGMRAGMDRKTARRYLDLGKLPSQLKQPRTWRTREDPFTEDWPELAAMLEDAPELEARALFDYLMALKPERYHPGQVRTFQRRVKQWRAEHGPPKELWFPQAHRPGEAMQTDFTWATELGITIAGEPFPHMLCHPVLPYSNWEWATICGSESMLALRRGIQEAVFRLGRIPEYHQTDNSTAATHDLRNGRRGFNDEYADFIAHLGMAPRTIGVGEKEQNGDTEAAHGALKRRLKQHLLLRGSRDFGSVEHYERWLWETLTTANVARQAKVAEDLAAMRPLVVERLPEFVEARVRVNTGSTIVVKHNTYSVPARLSGEWVTARIYEDRVEIRYAGKHQLTMERQRGRGGHRIDYRHIIWSLVRKPGAFARYRYREDLFPTLAFRKAYDALAAHCETERKADIEYLRILHLAASTMESDVETALVLLDEQHIVPTSDRVKAIVAPAKTEVPHLEIPTVELDGYDELLGDVEEGSR